MQRRVAAAACLTLGAVLVLPASGAAAVKLSVPCHGAKGGVPGLIAAIQQANRRGGAITLARDCTYTLTRPRFGTKDSPVGLPPIAARVTVEGRRTGIVRRTGSAQFRLFEVAGSTSAALDIAGLTLRGGNVEKTGNGGAILVREHGSLAVRDCVLIGNAAVNGGAIDAGGAAVKITRSRFDANKAVVADGVGGAVLVVAAPLTIDSSVVTGNHSAGGGGGVSGQSIGGRSQLLRITKTTISDNHSFENGGAGVLAFGPERVVIDRSTISGNDFAGVGVAGAGGGIFNAGRMTITDSTITGNIAGGPRFDDAIGAGIFNTPTATGTITATTIAGNRSIGPGASGGGIVNGSRLTLTATIVANNHGGNCTTRVRDGGYNLETGTSCGFAKHAVTANPRLRPLASNGGPTMTMALAPGSPAIDWIAPRAGSCRGSIDQRGVPRPQGQRCDIGAFEVVATKTLLRVARRGNRIRLMASVTPAVGIPGQPHGVVVFRSGTRVLGTRRLDGRATDAATLTVARHATKQRLTASYQGSTLFLPSVGRAVRPN